MNLVWTAPSIGIISLICAGYYSYKVREMPAGNKRLQKTVDICYYMRYHLSKPRR